MIVEKFSVFATLFQSLIAVLQHSLLAPAMFLFYFVGLAVLLQSLTVLCSSSHVNFLHSRNTHTDTNITLYKGAGFARSLPDGMCSVEEPCADGSCCNAERWEPLLRVCSCSLIDLTVAM
jgi:hypothetical protein